MICHTRLCPSNNTHTKKTIFIFHAQGLLPSCNSQLPVSSSDSRQYFSHLYHFFWSTITSPVYSLLVITLTQSSYIEVNHIFGYLAPIDPFSVPFLVKNVEQLCYKSHWFPKGNSGFWQWNSQMGRNRLLHHIISLTIWLSESHMVEKPMDRMWSRWRDTKN